MKIRGKGMVVRRLTSLTATMAVWLVLLSTMISLKAAVIYGVGYSSDSNDYVSFGQCLDVNNNLNSWGDSWMSANGGTRAGIADFRASVTLDHVYYSYVPGNAGGREVTGLDIYVSDNPAVWGSPVASVTGISPTAVDYDIPLGGASGRYVKVVLTANNGDSSWTSVGRLRFDGPTGTTLVSSLTGQPLPLTEKYAVVASAAVPNALYPPSNLTDNSLATLALTTYSLTPAQGWIRLDMADALVKPVGTLAVWSWDNNSSDIVLVQTSTDNGGTWTDAGFYTLPNNSAGAGPQLIQLPSDTQANAILLSTVRTHASPDNTGIVRWTEMAVFAPIPEPATLALLALGGLGLLRHRRHCRAR